MNGGRYGIPFDVMTPDVLGERHGSGRIPGGVRGYTWSDWALWVAPGDGSGDDDSECTDRDWLTGECRDDPAYQEKVRRGRVAMLLFTGLVLVPVAWMFLTARPPYGGKSALDGFRERFVSDEEEGD